jgi:hypothetical protein
MLASGLKKLNNFPYAKVSRKKIQIYHVVYWLLLLYIVAALGMVV